MASEETRNGSINDGDKSKKKEKKQKAQLKKSFYENPEKVDIGVQAGDSMDEIKVRYKEPNRGNSSYNSLRRSSTTTMSLPRRSWETEDYIDFDDLLPMIGEFRFFQVMLLLFMIPFCFITAFVYLGQIFMSLTPPKYYCYVPELTLMNNVELRKQLSIPREKDGSYSCCRMYDTNYTKIHFAPNPSAYINTSLPTMPCKRGYVFEQDEKTYISATMEFGWLCDDDKYATYAQIIFFVGSILGALGYGYFADHCGRLAALVSSSFVALLGSFATSMSYDFFSFALSRFIVGTSYDTGFTMVYILVLEYVGPKYRTLVANLSLALFYCPCTMLMPWIALSAGDWRRFSAYASLPIVLAMFSYCLIPESARCVLLNHTPKQDIPSIQAFLVLSWLVSVGDIEGAMEILKRVMRINKKNVAPQILELFETSCTQFYKEELHGRDFNVFSIFKRRRLARYMVLLIIIWMAMSLVYDGHVRAASVLDSQNIFVFFTIACATELPGSILVIFTLDRCGRRWCSFAFTSLSGVFSLVGAGLTNRTLMRISALAGRFFANMCYNIGLQWAAEILPTVVRAQGVALIHTMGFVAMLLSPPVVYLSHVSFPLMLLVLGALGLLGGLLALFLPETLNHELPQTLSDGAEFGRNQRLWHVPCCGRGARKSHPRHWRRGSSLRTLSREEFRSSRMFRKTDYVHREKSQPSSENHKVDEKVIRTYKYNG
ncbi:beta-alanine transporter isoform X2 [Drosophila elegans]|uniref:beta-alanine transporter isoform X2 n=1 Tax=Drosophila elegans TaxID=30023 RepID=UPI001BC85C51|nr:beta-alanine transporter isoform X2 [Drosophila elegans]